MIVAVANLGLMLGTFPVMVFPLGVFFPAYLLKFDANRTAISLAFTLLNLISTFCAFFAGCLGTASLKQNHSPWMLWNYRETLARLVTPAAG